MARRRSVEQANRRRGVLDRVVVALLIVLALSGAMSLLPGTGQATVARTACQVTSLGLSSCSSLFPETVPSQLGPPRCRLLAEFDQVIPEVRDTSVTSAAGVPVVISTARDGDATLRLPGSDAPPPDMLAGQPRESWEPTPGVIVPTAAGWALPGGQGGEAVIAAIDAGHRRWLQDRSALALLSALLDGGGYRVPPPTLYTSRIDLTQSPFLSPAEPAPPAGVGGLTLAIQPGTPAVMQFNTATGTSRVTARLRGGTDEQPLAGAVQVTRDPAGQVTRIVIATGSADRLLPGKPVGQADAWATVVSVPVKTAAERDLANAWLGAPSGFAVDLAPLLGHRPAADANRREQWLVRGAAAFSLGLAGPGAAPTTERLVRELSGNERREDPAVRLLQAEQIRPDPTSGRRQATADTSCL
ncbi:hypothetical protein [Naumannella cuiyingiana]|uniref:Uncharacterized protein n=1 Tax=Naumannella cuiyingiana TaxID=1347891 RepID=A0A7Z0D8F4_9ACTN|nr:hypothetical protein [Naumannella cuiyingiana]NYI70855.1 hypothetical protein [Naumannella cuiyingiana]